MCYISWQTVVSYIHTQNKIFWDYRIVYLYNIDNSIEKKLNILMIEVTYMQNHVEYMENVSFIIESLKAVLLVSMKISVCSVD